MEEFVNRMTVGEVISETLDVARRNALVLLVAVLILGVINWLKELTADGSARSGSAFFSVVVGYYVLRELLKREGLMEARGRAWAYVVSAIVSGFATIVGLLFLIAPGLYLLARWSLAPSLIIAHGDGPIEALRESWRATRASVWSLVLAFVIIFGGLAAVAIVLIVPIVLLQSDHSPAVNATTAGFAAVWAVVASTLNVAVYRRLVGGTQEYEQLFA